jgi:2-desacetyl-2-hydroxyethyl bacteriochlorophyllide A dehydrogenase
MKNRYILFPSKMSAAVADGELAAPGPEEVLVKTVVTLISPGTELASYEGTHSSFLSGRTAFPCPNPGYSNVGIIEALGAKVTGYAIGEKVFSLVGHADRGLAWQGNISQVPAGLGDEGATFAAVGAVALHGIRATSFSIGETVLILGQGLIGQLALRLAALTGVKTIIAADNFANRLALAQAGGATHTINVGQTNLEEEIAGITGKTGCHVVIDTTGNPRAIRSALAAAAQKGRVIILGCPHGEVSLNLYTEFQIKELSLIGSYQPGCPHTATAYYPWSQSANRQTVLEYIRDGKIDVAPLITHRDHFTAAQRLYHALSQEKDKAIAAIMTWN